MSLTEFNQNPSRASRLAEHDKVRVTRRGQPYLLLVRDDEPIRTLSPNEQIEQLVAAGKLLPASQTSGMVSFCDYQVDPVLAAAELRQFETERDSLHY
jgi:hypothetical protein